MSISKIAQWNTTDQSPDYGWYNTRKAGVIREKCVLGSGNASYTLKQKLPGSTRRLWAMLHYGTAPSFTWASTSNSPTGAVVLTDVAPTSLNGTVTTDIFVLGSTTMQLESLGAGAIAVTVGTTVAMGEWLPSEFTRGLTTIAVGVAMLLAVGAQLKRGKGHGHGRPLGGAAARQSTKA